MAETKTSADAIKTLDKFSKQLHMYTSDDLRSALKMSISIAKGAINSGNPQEALVTGLEKDEGMITLPAGSGLKAQPGDDVRIEVESGDGSIQVYVAEVVDVKSQQGDEVCLLKDFALLEQGERRRAKRHPVHIKTKYYSYRDGENREFLYDGTVLNISDKGLYLASDIPMKDGNGIVFMTDIGLENMEMPSGTSGTIVRAKREDTNFGYLYSYGVKFNLPLSAA